jgi:biopolymer transport protein ExbD
MRKKHIAAVQLESEDNEINLTPMLDVVFIMLIFFIVTATFIRESGLEAQRPDQNDQPQVLQEDGAILVIIDNNDDLWIDGQVIDERRVRARIEAMHAENIERPVVIQAEPNSSTAKLVGVMDAAQLVGIYNISIVSGGG